MQEINQEVSFRGNPIPEVQATPGFTVSDSKEVINKVTSMKSRDVTIEAIHYSNDLGISDVKLSTGDIVPIETAIALAGNNYLKGYSTGKTVRGGRTLRSKPDPKNSNVKGIHQLPKF